MRRACAARNRVTRCWTSGARVVGYVTSCAIDAEGYLLGQAIVPVSMSEPGTAVSIYQLGGGTRAIKLPKELKLGARLPMPDGATVLTRFPSRKKKA